MPVFDPDEGANGNLTYAIIGGSGLGIFAIDSGSGGIRVADATALDAETTAQFDLVVEVVDGGGLGVSATVQLLVADTNDVLPIVTPGQTFAVDENSPGGTSVGMLVATDADVTPATFQDWSITGGTGASAFAIDPQTGAITVIGGSPLDREVVSSLTLQVTVSDGGNTSLAETVTVEINDVNEFAPTLSDAAFSIDENTADGFSIATLTGTDADSTTGGFRYTIVAGNDLAIFAIDNSGKLLVGDNSNLDYESVTQVVLTIEVNDEGPGESRSATATVTIDINPVNDNAPEFTSPITASVAENTSLVQTLSRERPRLADASTNVLYHRWCRRWQVQDRRRQSTGA